MKMAVLFLFVTLALGSWWAEQELIWNNWWSWDLIELILYILLLLMVFNLHFFKILYNQLFLNFFYILILSKFLLFLFLVRMNLINSLHTFIPTVGAEQFSFYLIFSLSIYYVVTCFFKKNKLLNFFFKAPKKKNLEISTIYYLFQIFLIFILLIFLTQLFINFFFKSNFIDFLKFNSYFIIYTLCIIIIPKNKIIFFFHQFNKI
jgi:cytochrome c biogenesis factor